MCKARCSVVIPVFNGGKYLRDAIAGVLSQDVYALEIIIVDDGSTDDTAKIATGFGGSIRYHYQANKGAGAARNQGVAMTRGDFIAFLDADDLWTENKLKQQCAAFAADSDLDMVFGHIQQFYSPELTVEERAGIGMPVEIMPGYHAGAMLVRREAFHRVGFFNPALRIGEFIDWYTRAMEKKLKNIMLPEVVMKRRIHRTNLGVSCRRQRVGYIHALKAALDRRRSEH